MEEEDKENSMVGSNRYWVSNFRVRCLELSVLCVFHRQSCAKFVHWCLSACLSFVSSSGCAYHERCVHAHVQRYSMKSSSLSLER